MRKEAMWTSLNWRFSRERLSSPWSFKYWTTASPSCFWQHTLKMPFYIIILNNTFITVWIPSSKINFCFSKVRIMGTLKPLSTDEGRKEGSTPKSMDLEVAEMWTKSLLFFEAKRMILEVFTDDYWLEDEWLQKDYSGKTQRNCDGCRFSLLQNQVYWMKSNTRPNDLSIEIENSPHFPLTSQGQHR